VKRGCKDFGRSHVRRGEGKTPPSGAIERGKMENNAIVTRKQIPYGGEVGNVILIYV